MESKHEKFRLHNIYLRIAIPLSLLLLALSFTQTAFYTDSPENGTFASFFVFCFGWSAFLASEFVESLIWLANPLYILAIVLIGYNRKIGAIISSLASLFLALYFLTRETIATSESGIGPYYLITITWGYWLWLSSIAILVIGILLSYFDNKKLFSQ